MSRAVIIVGFGGHARVLLDAMLCSNMNVLGFVDRENDCSSKKIRFLGDDDVLLSNFPPDEIYLVNGLGGVANMKQHEDIFNRFKRHGYKFSSVIHPSAIVADDVVLGEGCQIMAGAVLQTGVQCGKNVIVNTRAGIDHDCSIASHTHISVGATLSGSVRVGEKSYIGAGATVIQGVEIGNNSIIAAGAVVINHVKAFDTVLGVPARVEK